LREQPRWEIIIRIRESLLTRGDVNLPAATARNRALQTEYYGEPLGDRFRRLLDSFGFSQLQLADLLGLSPSMLSQLMSAHRAKISNPVVLSRLLAAEMLARRADWPALPPAERATLLGQVRLDRATITGTGSTEPQPTTDRAEPDLARSVQALLRAVASATEIEAAAALLAPDLPSLAEALRVLGNGRTGDARAYLLRVLGNGR
jgi:transcriptional regulator with XRE-family HTH domain